MPCDLLSLGGLSPHILSVDVVALRMYGADN